MDAVGFAYSVVLVGALIKFADWVAPYESLTAAGCTLDYVYDGDTVALNCDGKIETARLVGFDAPEATDPGCQAEERAAAEATAKLRRLAQGGQPSFDGEGRDKYGRLLAVMRINGRDVADTMIADGHAVAYHGGTRINWCARLEEL